jgi:hypothetical protein
VRTIILKCIHVIHIYHLFEYQKFDTRSFHWLIILLFNLKVEDVKSLSDIDDLSTDFWKVRLLNYGFSCSWMFGLIIG